MKFTLIVLPIRNVGNQLPNLGAIVIAQRVRELGHEVNVIDVIRYRHIKEEVIEEIDKFKPQLIGISGIITTYYYFEPLVARLKKSFPEVPIVVGGGIVSAIELIEKYTEVDYFIKGEGEDAIAELILELNSNRSLADSDIPGLFVRVGKYFKAPNIEQTYIDISRASFPAYDLYDMEYYIKSSTQNAYRFLEIYPELHRKVGPSIKFFPAAITRGCPYTCSFCYRLIRKYRYPKVDNAIKHLEMIKEKYGCSGINLIDELIIGNRDWFIEFCDALADRLPGLYIFAGGVRADLLTPEIISYAKKAGFIRFGCGVESGSQTMLNNINKKTTVEQNYNAIKQVKNAGIMATCSFIFGCVGENRDTIRETENFIFKTLDPRDYTVNLAVAYPGAPLFNYAIEKGILKKEQIHDYVLNINFGNYPLNFSDFNSGIELCREVNLMQFRLKVRFMLKSHEYRLLGNIITKHLTKEIFYLLCKVSPKSIQVIRSIYDGIQLRKFNKKRRKERVVKIIFSNNLKKIKALVKNLNENVMYLILSKNQETEDIARFLRSFKHFISVDRDGLLNEHKDTFKRNYVEFIARLNSSKHPFDWEALNFVSKSRLSFDFYYRLFYASIINNLLKDIKNIKTLLIISDDYNLSSQIKLLSKNYGYTFVSAITPKPKNYLFSINRYFPIFLILVFLRTLFFKIILKIFFKNLKFKDRKYYIIKSLITLHSFDANGQFRDTYFHKFIEYLNLSRKNIPILVYATIFKPYITNVFRIKKCISDITIIPRELYISIFDIVKCFMRSLKRYIWLFDIRDDLSLNSTDVRCLVQAEIKMECGLKDFFLNLLEYCCMKSFVHYVEIDRVIYPFEHRSWESMLIIALRQQKLPIKMIGYQHTSIAPKHTNFILGKNEAEYIILPDKIICMGKATKDIMEKIGNFPNKILETGCALRQNLMQPVDYRLEDIRNISNILVALTTDTNEYTKILRFLNQAFSNHNLYKIKIRPHPITEIERGSWIVNDLRFNFEIDRDKDLLKSLAWAHIVCYTSSTVSIEAIERGIPVLYLDLGDTLCPDPLFELNYFKWSVSIPEKLIETIDAIKDIPENVFDLAKRQANRYASDYIYPATQEKLDIFFKHLFYE